MYIYIYIYIYIIIIYIYRKTERLWNRFRVLPERYEYRKRIYTEAKAKVVSALWGTEFIQFLAALQDDLKKWMNRKMDTWWNGCFGTIG